MTRPLSDEEFRQLLGSLITDAFYFEAQETYALDYERPDLERFRAGNPLPPPQVDWWRPWLEQIAALTEQGKQVSRVRVISEPPSDYQLWQMWAIPWHSRAGEQISYLTRSEANGLRLPLDSDWWLLDGTRLIELTYDARGQITSKMLLTDPETVAQHRDWRDLAVRNAIPAEEYAAA